ncbi:MAG TPA: segregation/condensation protein A [Candidatus Eisenbacteria bacterium]|nr:segregation/condensation protein A [Candidatus Eisenbacteria bacterium]
MSYKIRLDIFEGPLDLLLYLIKKEELNIYDIPITRITEQYLEHLNLMELLDLDVAGEFLVMAATLMQIKSRMLLPPDPEGVETDQEDPRAELVRRLLEYKAFKEAAERLRDFEGKRGGLFTRTDVEPELDGGDSPFFEVSLFELISAFSKVLKFIPKEMFHSVMKDEFTVAEKVHEIFHRLVNQPSIRFSSLFREAKNKIEAITTFLALLELIRLKEVTIAQEAHFEDILISRNVRGPAGGETPEPQSPALEGQHGG